MDPKAIKELVAFGKEELLDAKGLDVFAERPPMAKWSKLRWLRARVKEIP